MLGVRADSAAVDWQGQHDLPMIDDVNGGIWSLAGAVP